MNGPLRISAFSLRSLFFRRVCSCSCRLSTLTCLQYDVSGKESEGGTVAQIDSLLRQGEVEEDIPTEYRVQLKVNGHFKAGEYADADQQADVNGEAEFR